MAPTWMVCTVLLAGGGEEKSAQPRTKSAPAPLVWPHEEPADRLAAEPPLSPADAKRIEADKRFAIGEMYARQDRLSEAIRMFREALREDPKHLEALRQAAPIAAQLDRREESLDLCRRALAIGGSDADLLYLQGVLLTAADDVEGALAALEKACKLPWLAEEKPSRYVNVREVLVDLYQRKGDEAGLARTLGELIDVIENPDRYEIEQPLRRQLEQSRLSLYLRRAEALRKGKQFAAAVAVLEDLGKRDPRAGNQLKLELAQVHFDAGDFPAALQTVEQYLNALEAKSRSPYELLEQTLIRLKRDKEVIETLENLSQRQPTNESLKRFLAQKLFDAGKYRRVEDLVSGSSDRETQMLLLRTYQKLGHARKLLDVLSTLGNRPQVDDDVGPLLEDLAKDRSLVKLIAQEAERLPQRISSSFIAFHVVAKLAKEAGENDLAAEFYKRCSELEPQSKALRAERMISLLQAERFAECLQASDQALALAPSEIEFARLKALALTHLDRLPEGVKVLQDLRGKVAGPDQLLEIGLALGGIYQQAKEWPKAAETYRKLIEDHPDGRQAHYCRYLLASVYSQMGDSKQAEAELLKIIAANPANQPHLVAGANNDLGYLWADEGKNLDRAEQMIRSALKADKENAAYLDSLGWVLFKRGRYQEAKDYLKRAAASKAGDDPVVWDHLGDALIQLGDKPGAAAAWGKAGDYFSKGLHGNPKEKAEGIRKKLEMVTGKAAAGVSGK